MDEIRVTGEADFEKKVTFYFRTHSADTLIFPKGNACADYLG
jgi:hypothetical protein